MTQIKGAPSLNRKKQTDAPFDLPITVGVRMRLTPDQKQQIKRRFDELSRGEHQPESISTLPGSLSVTTAANPAQLIHEMGCDRSVLSSLLGSNERHALPMIKRWERVLGIQLISKKDLEAAFKQYMEHMCL